MGNLRTRSVALADLGWLSRVREIRQPLTDSAPIWVRHGVHEGPTPPTPQTHPYCEMAFVRTGGGIQYVGNEQADMQAGDFFIAGPGVPHAHRVTGHPQKYAAIHFLPGVLVGGSAGADGLRVLRRFTLQQPLRHRLFRPSAPLRKRLEDLLDEMIHEFDGKSFGHQMVLQGKLFELAIAVLRWEESSGLSPPELQFLADDWRPLDAALRCVRENFASPLYAGQVAKAAGVGETKLRELFHRTLATTPVHYIQSYRVHRAAELLSRPDHNVTQAAMSVGFDSLSHFNFTFRKFFGVGPKAYQKRVTTPTSPVGLQ